MRTPLIAGNWKMNNTIDESADLAMKLRKATSNATGVEVLVAPPFTALHHLSHLLADSHIKLGAQDMHWETNGAFTGEVSAKMLGDVGCEYVIIGHSERRTLFGETDESVHKKLSAAVGEGLRPIVCVGESLEQRESGEAIDVVRGQLRGALGGHGPGILKETTIAYEPVWAIGTGKNASKEEAEEVHGAIRELLYEDFDKEAVDEIRIIYGGSVKPENIGSLMAQPNIDGALVGGASLKAEDFSKIVNFG